MCLHQSVNISTNTDKFYHLQLLVDSCEEDVCFVCAHWGRTGSKGQSKALASLVDMEEAKQAFEKHFKAKTGAKFADRLSYTAKSKK